jgi:hypothetical protein
LLRSGWRREARMKMPTKYIISRFLYNANPDKIAVRIARKDDTFGSILKSPCPFAFDTSNIYKLFDIADTIASSVSNNSGIEAISKPR